MASPPPSPGRPLPALSASGLGTVGDSSGPAVAFLAPDGQPGRFQLAEGGLDGVGLSGGRRRVQLLGASSAACTPTL
jgi:hypothetical protein